MVRVVVLLVALTALPGIVGAQVPSFKDKSARVLVGVLPGGGSVSAGRLWVAPHKTPAAIVQMLRGAFDKLANHKQFIRDWHNVGGEDDEMLFAATIQPLVMRLLVILLGARHITKKITGNYSQG